MENVLVTGGAGFIGSALVRGLLADDSVRRVLVLDNFTTGKRENLAGLEDQSELRKADIRDYGAIEPLFAGIDVVFHLAAVSSVARSIEEPELTHDVNVNGTLNVLLAAERRGVGRLVYAASAAAYGDSPELPKRESMAPNPKSPYAVHKLMGEYYAQTFQRVYGLETVSLRYFNVFGPRQDPASPYSGVLTIFSTCLADGRAPTINGDGEQSRDFVYIDNIVRLSLLAARSPKAAGKVYNGGLGESHSLNQTWALMQAIEGVEMPAEHGPARRGDIRHSRADMTAARRDLGFEPVVSFEQGLRRTLEWYREMSLPRPARG